MFYVYEHIRKDTNAIFYVGKGKEYRANSTKDRNQYWHNVVNKANGFTVNYVAKDLDEELAYLCEQERINQLKKLGVVLTNLTLGGEGASGGENHHMWGKPHPRRGMHSILKGRYVGKLNPMYGKVGAMKGVPKPKGKNSPLYGRKRPEKAGKPPKSVKATDKDGNVLHFISLTEASKFIKSDRHSIQKWCKMNQFKKGYNWEFLI